MSAEHPVSFVKQEPLNLNPDVNIEEAEKAQTERNASDIQEDASIDAENEVQGLKLILIHTAICICTFLVGLVR